MEYVERSKTKAEGAWMVSWVQSRFSLRLNYPEIFQGSRISSTLISLSLRLVQGELLSLATKRSLIMSGDSPVLMASL